MDIKILGPGCRNCATLEKRTHEALAELGQDATVTKVTDYAEIAAYGVMQTPALVIDEQVVVSGKVPVTRALRELTGTEQMEVLAKWYTEQGKAGTPIGFFQIGGGIAADFPICVMPMLIQDLELEDTPYWAYFCQISDSTTSYGSYSGAVPNEKITWGKLDIHTPKFMINSDAAIVAPLIFSYVLGD